MTSEAQIDFQNLLGDAGWLSGDDNDRYTQDWLKLTARTALGVARPDTAETVAECVKLCRKHRLALIPQGGNTGLVLGSIPSESHEGSVILSLERMHTIESIDPIGGTVCLQAGVVLDQLQLALSEKNLHIPLHLGSSGSAQIGGLVSTNAGGSHAFRDGMMADQVLGLEVVLPSGDIWQGNRALLKDNAGYALRRLFCGAEGTLGIITRVTLQAVHKPVETNTLLLGCESLADALAILTWCRSQADGALHAVEFMHQQGVNLVIAHCPEVNFPLDAVPPFTLLLEFVSPCAAMPLEPLVNLVLQETMEQKLVTDGVLAANEQQRENMWLLRESIPEGQRRQGKQLKHDVAVPVASLSQFIIEATEAVHAVVEGCLVNPFGHLADGNVHFNLSPPEGAEDRFFELENDLKNAVYDTVVRFNGSIAAEHGLGRTKVDLADRLRSPVERDLMRAIKAAIDPTSLMNPGVIVHMDNDSH